MRTFLARAAAELAAPPRSSSAAADSSNRRSDTPSDPDVPLGTSVLDGVFLTLIRILSWMSSSDGSRSRGSHPWYGLSSSRSPHTSRMISTMTSCCSGSACTSRLTMMGMWFSRNAVSLMASHTSRNPTHVPSVQSFDRRLCACMTIGSLMGLGGAAPAAAAAAVDLDRSRELDLVRDRGRPSRSLTAFGSRLWELSCPGTVRAAWLALALRWWCESFPAINVVTASIPSCTVVATDEDDKCLRWRLLGDLERFGVLDPDLGGRFQTSISMHRQPVCRTCGDDGR